LKKEEIDEIMHVETEASEALHEITHLVRDSHELIKSIQLRLLQPKLSQAERKDLEEHLKSANTSLKSRQVMFNTTAQGVGFINAFIKHHR
jgi:seryl-tRNA synthetase